MRAQLYLGVEAGLGEIAKKHNEIVLDTRSIERNLPRIILGFFYRDDDGEARAARDAFIRMYKLSPKAVPLVHLDLSAPRAEDVFKLVSEH